jgi:tight adherence protein C
VRGDLVLAVGLGAIFVGVLIILGVLATVILNRQQGGRSLAALAAFGSNPARNTAVDAPFLERVVRPLALRLTRLGRRLTPVGQIERMRRRLEGAGNPPGWDVDRLLAFKMLGLIAGVVIGLAIPLLFGWGVLVAVILGALLGAAGLLTPDAWLYQAAYNRTESLRRELADALDLLSISVEAGLAFDAALSQVARNMHGPLAQEFSRVLQEMQIGMSRSNALRALGERSNAPELRGFVTAMIQADTFGIPIAKVLRVQAKDLRSKRAQYAEELAHKIPVKILFPLIFCILPCLFVIVIGPAAIGVYHAFAQR